jgi:hypothetical protein
VDEGLPVAYIVLEEGVTVYASDGIAVGVVDHVVAAPELDIFHGIVVRVQATPRFVAADQVASLHERGVDLLIDAADCARLTADAPTPQGAEHDDEPTPWTNLVEMFTGKHGRSGR